MANDLIAVLGARLDQFSADLDQAGNMADDAISRIESAFASLNPGFGGLTGLGTVLGGAAAAAGALFAALTTVNSEVAAIGKNAEYVGLTVEDFQRKLFGAGQGGVSSEQATKDLRNLAGLLADARDNENSLTKLLDANNVKYRERNGQVIGVNQALKVAEELLGRFQSLPEKTKAAEMLGLSEGWVRALTSVAGGFDAIANKADAAGAVIDGATVAKAQLFERAWQQSTDAWGRQFKAVAGDIAVALGSLVDQAGDLLSKALAASNVQPGSGQDKFNALADAADLVRKDIQGLPQDLEQIDRVLERLRNNSGVDPALIEGLEDLRAKAKATADEMRGLQVLAAKMQFPDGVPLPAARPAGANEPGPNAARLPTRRRETGDARDQFDAAVDSITKRTATLKADTAAMFESNAVQAQLRAEFQELTAIMRANGEVTQEQIDNYEQLRKTMSAQQALEAAGITLTADHAQKFIESSEAIKQATLGYDQAREALVRVNSASALLGQSLSTAFADAIVEGGNLNEVVSNLGKTLAKAGINSLFQSFFSAPASGGFAPFASLLKGFIPGFAEGTDSAPGGLAWVGENGKELVNLPRGSQVIPNDAVRQATSGSTIQNTFMVAGDVAPGTIDKLQAAVVAAHRKVDKISKVMVSTQRMQATGVG
ncbi:hypothetical protein E4K66_30760 [Bradyrhizobium frederickii]|uniref:Bacteriophage tail tape measure N-terminal domain-containing protein n=1 Tax=Bradyrhizobium frederickii TaxID=2560054 RepID=A0A4Y9KT87_9BRAD|nr:hypothetical protein [Bradyrhizobium frederickii]TFV34550.1 hypothetical protein E4K66_30760 [Bradyrhizobium frederickii]